jgi:predicted nuclease of predicted toxin-antitoxin system
MNILADENIAQTIVSLLRAEGHQVRHIAEIAASSPDADVLEIANRYEALLLTEDKDFGELVIRHRSKATGVLLVRLEGFTPLERAEVISKVVREQGEYLLGAFTVIKPRVVRIRRNPNTP